MKKERYLVMLSKAVGEELFADQIHIATIMVVAKDYDQAKFKARRYLAKKLIKEGRIKEARQLGKLDVDWEDFKVSCLDDCLDGDDIQLF